MNPLTENNTRQIPTVLQINQEQRSLPRNQFPPHDFCGVKLRGRQSSSAASDRVSTDDESLFIALKRTRRHGRSLSPISNRPRQMKCVPSDQEFEGVDDRKRDKIAWDIVNREISEWQYVCQTGCPRWWSTFSKWGREHGSAWKEDTFSISQWPNNVVRNHPPGRRYDLQRRAVTDSYTPDNNTHDLAHMIAVQLLSACFTLPLDRISSHKLSRNPYSDTLDSGNIPDSRLISSLRMHTEVRYSPSFGHQARNSSPASLWQGGYDGSNLSNSPEQSFGQESPEIGTSERFTRRKKTCHVTENPIDEYPGAGNLDDGKLLERGKSKVFPIQELESHREPTRATRRRRLSLQPVIRSEPHPIYIQPVKDLVVKRWRTFRRCFGDSLGQDNPDPNSTAADFMVPNYPPNSASSNSPGSSAPSGEAKGRRRLAREEGDIHSSSVESNPGYSSPVPTADSGITSPANIDLHNLSPNRQNTSNVLVASVETSPNMYPTRAVTDFPSQISLSMPKPQFSSGVPSPPSPTVVLADLMKLDGTLGQNAQKCKVLASPRRHRQRKGVLSGVRTSDDIEEERNVFSAAGSALASPIEESSCEATHGLGIPIPGNAPPELGVTALWSSPLATLPDVEIMDRSSWRIARPKTIRVSTNGTQIFRPTGDKDAN